MSKTYKEVIEELDALVDEYTLLNRDTNKHISTQLGHDIDEFLISKIGDAYSPEGEYVWYSMVIKYPNIYDKEKGMDNNTNTLNKHIQVLKDKYK